MGRQESRPCPYPIFQLGMPSQHEISHGGHVGKKLDVLECAGNSNFRHLIGFKRSNILIPEKYLPITGLIDAADAIENRGLPCPVGADDGITFSFFYLEGHPAQCFQSSKTNR